MTLLVQSAGATALERFARWFHQDFAVQFASHRDGADAYVAGISAGERAELAAALRALLAEFPGGKGHGLRNAFLRLGAGSAPRKGREVRALLEHVIRAVVQCSVTSHPDCD
jgi:hypothetical protein